MIIRCKKCGTTYRLDDAKIKATGTKVRCSRCMHEFTVSLLAVTDIGELFGELSREQKVSD
ncbi:MAG: zinc-ribbon domain-containing protein, partial [Deltaproteobacteria bacterium]|nr:zinc-ribbon domain-containing protein [Deltaproteobacteria bacterium]